MLYCRRCNTVAALEPDDSVKWIEYRAARDQRASRRRSKSANSSTRAR
jgi:hypothetical protein